MEILQQKDNPKTFWEEYPLKQGIDDRDIPPAGFQGEPRNFCTPEMVDDYLTRMTLAQSSKEMKNLMRYLTMASIGVTSRQEAELRR